MLDWRSYPSCTRPPSDPSTSTARAWVTSRGWRMASPSTSPVRSRSPRWCRSRRGSASTDRGLVGPRGRTEVGAFGRRSRRRASVIGMTHTLDVSVPPSRVEVGHSGEAAALAHYRGTGYRVVARNWRCPLGEIDLVVSKGSLLVFCEVKSRRSVGFGGPFEAVDWRKQRKLRMLADAFLAGTGGPATGVRFDVASVTLDARGNPSVFVFEDAF